MKKSDIGVIGLSVMGKNLALNMAEHGYKVSIYNRTGSVTEKVMNEHPEFKFTDSYKLEDFISSLEKPRKVFIMVKAGKPVDLVIDSLIPLLEKGDIIIDGGNSYFEDTIRREKYLAEKGLFFVGAGVSGGETGARFGPAIMPGGDKYTYENVGKILEDISAKVKGEPCCTYIGENGAGHYVKMVHNGIEYADMQLISEAYMILKHLGGYTNEEIHNVFEKWNKGRLESYLIEITSDIFTEKDDETGNYLVDMILDKAAQKGTGKWTNMEALNLGVDISIIGSALNARYMSAFRDERVRASKIIKSGVQAREKIDREKLEKELEASLYIAKIVCYSQGFRLLSEAAKAYGWELDFSAIAKIFRGGCIIRAAFLDDIASAFKTAKRDESLILTDFFSREINENINNLRSVVSTAVLNGISAPAFSSAISYLDAERNDHSGANLIQAQRDYFGAHTFERVDKEGSFHNEWVNDNE